MKGRVEIVYNRFGEMGAGLRPQVDRFAGHTAYNILSYAKQLQASGPKTGRVYRRGNVEHQASAPGEAPAVDLGNLINSGGVEALASCLWAIFFTAEYAKPLEFGTPRMSARPFLRPSVERFRQAYYDGIAALVGRV